MDSQLGRKRVHRLDQERTPTRKRLRFVEAPRQASVPDWIDRDHVLEQTSEKIALSDHCLLFLSASITILNSNSARFSNSIDHKHTDFKKFSQVKPKLQDRSHLSSLITPPFITMFFARSLCLLWLTLIIKHLVPSDINDISMTSVTGESPYTIRFAPTVLKLSSIDVAACKATFRRHLSNPSLMTIGMLLLAGDVEINPGPRVYRFPCGVCSAPVKSNQKGIFCDVCSSWLHARCIGLNNEEYLDLQSSEDSWSCQKCLNEALPFTDTSMCDTATTPSSSPSDANNSLAQFWPNHKSLTVLYTNCRSLSAKSDELKLSVSMHNPHLVCVCETWLDESIPDNEVTLPGYCLIRRDRDRHGGGVAMFIHDTIPFSILMKHSTIELLVLELKLKRQNLVCALFYRPPSSTNSLLLELESTLDALPPAKTKSTLLLGDFNIDVSSDHNNNCLHSIQDKLGLKQVVNTPTRTTNSTSTIIDHVYVSDYFSSNHSVMALTITVYFSRSKTVQSPLINHVNERFGSINGPTLTQRMTL